MTVTDRTYGTQLVEKHNDWDFINFHNIIKNLNGINSAIHSNSIFCK